MADIEELIAIVSPRSVGGISLFDVAAPITTTNFDGFRSDPSIVTAASNKLRELGFRVLDEGAITITIGGPPQLYEKVFGIQLRKERVTVMEEREVEFLAAPGPPPEQLLKPPGELVNLVEGAALSVPPVFFESPLPPLAPQDPAAYRYLFVPDEVGLLLNADRVHRLGATGKGIKVAMPDTGFYPHPFYTWHGYRVNATILGAGAANPSNDEYGHGTGEAANIFATAPDIELTPVKMGDPIDSFKKAVAANPRVITCSWGLTGPEDRAPNVLTPYAKALAAEIAAAVASGIVVCFAGGNGTFRGFPQGHPDIVSAGGVHVNYPFTSVANFEASSYASSFDSYFYPGRHVPDVCGLVGRSVVIGGGAKAPLLMLPVQPGCTLDGILPSTGANNDGWGLFSGTSAASPQVAGVVALMLEKTPSLKPADVKAKLMSSATDITTGSSAMGDPAGPGYDAATGAGLVNAKWAYLIAMGETLGQYLEAAPEQQARMVAEGLVPRFPRQFIVDLFETLRSR